MRRRWRKHVLAVAAVALIVFLGLTGRYFVWPRLPALPAHADAIVELAGPGNADRDRLAIQLAAQHRADYLVQSTLQSDADSGKCLPPESGVTVLCFHPDPDTTRGEAEAIGNYARQYGWHSIILVTTADHAWRARLRVTRCFPGQVYVAVSHLPPLYWFRQIPYQWAASAKAKFVQKYC
ncbi:YdcF family protein [Dactylosporangium sp. CA-233914]|uniref:YdcF family protein n=1 Tax=Dactylosporangium sp. CA-233914 TaxID=3239934 RepID=UPI003D9195FE